MRLVSEMTYYQKFAYILASIFFGVSALLLVKIPFAYQSETDFKDHAISTLGTVKKIEVKQQYVPTGLGGGRLETTYTSTIQFKTLEGEISTFFDSTHSPVENKEVPVLYTPAYPYQARVGTEVNPKHTVYGLLLASTFFLAGGMYTVCQTRRH